MTIYELAMEYGESAARLKGRIRELEQAVGETEDEGRQKQLEGRLRLLRSMYRDTRAVAKWLKGYYGQMDRGERRTGQ